MENNPKNPERKFEEEDSEENISADSKKSNKSKEKKPDEKPKLAKFFEPKKNSESDEKPENRTKNKPVNESESLSIEESGNLTESEVHEVVLSVVDARLQQVGEELENAAPDSEEEYTALSSVVFLEALAERAGSEQDITTEVIDSAYDETVDDITPRDTLVEVQSDIEPPESGNPLVPPTPPHFSSGVPMAPFPDSRTESSFNPSSTVETPDIYEAYIPRSDMLLGVVVGYIIGRRGGRIRTEKKLKPEIKKLENQVAELTEIIINKEKLIRKQSKVIYEKSFSVPDKTKAIIERRKVRTQVNEQLKRRNELLNDPGVEKIGKFSLPALKVFHERRLPDGTENSPKRIQVEVMTTEQLLEKVNGLKIDGLSVVLAFNQNRLSVDALRQITKEYLRGGEYAKTFNRELQPDPNEIEKHRSRIEEHHETSQKSDVKTELNQDNEIGDQSKNAKNNKVNSLDKSSETQIPAKSAIITLVILAVVIGLILLLG